MIPHFMSVHYVTLGFSNSSVCTETVTVQFKKMSTKVGGF